MRNTLAILAAACGLLLAAPATAATVTATQSVGFAFDLSGEGALDFRSFRYTCGLTVGAVCVGDAQLAAGARFAVDFGTTPGGADLRTLTVANIFSIPIDDFAGGFNPFLAVDAALDALFVTVRHVDDDFDVDGFALFPDTTPARILNGADLALIPVAAVPLPAPIASIAIGVLALGWAARRKRGRAGTT